MAVEYTANAVQTVASGANVLFTETPIGCNRGLVIHRNGSGIITLRGITNQCRARYRVAFNGNIAVATGGTVGAIALAIAIDGEAVPSATMAVTPAAIGDFFNVGADIFVDVPKGCCVTIAVTNVVPTVAAGAAAPTPTAIDVVNANIIVDRVA